MSLRTSILLALFFKVYGYALYNHLLNLGQRFTRSRGCPLAPFSNAFGVGVSCRFLYSFDSYLYILNDTSNVTDSVFAIFQKRLQQLNRTFHH